MPMPAPPNTGEGPEVRGVVLPPPTLASAPWPALTARASAELPANEEAGVEEKEGGTRFFTPAATDAAAALEAPAADADTAAEGMGWAARGDGSWCMGDMKEVLKLAAVLAHSSEQ